MKKCQNKKCLKEHNGSYGSGRFCSRACANSRTFSEASRLKKSKANKDFSSKNDMTRSKNFDLIKWKQNVKRTWETKLLKRKWNDLGYDSIRKRVILEQSYKCEKCNLSEWLGKPLTLELEHIDGNHQNNTRNNLIAICPNCHSLTDTWRGRNKQSNKYKTSDDDILNALQESKNIRQCLLKLKLAPKGSNYQRIKTIIDRFDLGALFGNK